jgi:hypothetical protein
VNGKPLKPGRYLITLRALDRKSGRPRDLAKPVAFRIRARLPCAHPPHEPGEGAA